MSAPTPADTGSPATQSTAAASSGIAGAGVVVICWALSLAHITVPAEVAASIMVCLMPALHSLALYMGAGEPVVVAPPPAPVPAPAPISTGATP